ncbi:hypothetical protein [Dyella sp.]|uniref:hypothetical protein n=1 Tax=Dyella sp. TaxID=1869338 RepID=UPI002D77C248|nr:hypothetical protein [Dyella sp.]HET7332986.1 hypothetical protein [Dyella sp.]
MAAHRSSDQRSSQRNDNDAIEPQAVSRALRKEGNAGGVSGTGQALPHHGFDAERREALGNPVSDEAPLPVPGAGSSYQAGGTHLNRERQVATRKDRLSGSTVASKAHDGPDPAPGAPANPK